MLQNVRKTIGFKKNMVYKISPGGGKPYLSSSLGEELGNFQQYYTTEEPGLRLGRDCVRKAEESGAEWLTHPGVCTAGNTCYQ